MRNAIIITMLLLSFPAMAAESRWDCSILGASANEPGTIHYRIRDGKMAINDLQDDSKPRNPNAMDPLTLNVVEDSADSIVATSTHPHSVIIVMIDPSTGAMRIVAVSTSKPAQELTGKCVRQ